MISAWHPGPLRRTQALRFLGRALVVAPRLKVALLCAVPVLLPCRSALACAACYGASDAPMARGMNWGIFSLLAIVGVVLGAVASFFVFLGVRAAKAPAAPASSGSTESTPTR